MLKIGLTGGIGSGKSTVAKIFEVLGIPVYYADDAAKVLMNTNIKVKEAIIKNFGEASYKKNQLDRSYIASLVFNDKEKLEILNSITHPATIQDANNWISKQKAPYILKEAALIFESGSNEFLDFVIGVHAPLPLRLQRVMQRDGISEEEVIKRMKQQMNEDEKMSKCRFVINNNEEELLIPQVLELDKKIRVLSI